MCFLFYHFYASKNKQSIELQNVLRLKQFPADQSQKNGGVGGRQLWML